MELVSYRKKDINAYLVKLLGLKPDNTYDFGTPLPGEEQKAYRGQSHKVFIDLEGKSGFYRGREAMGHKSHDSWHEIRNGEVQRSWDSENEYALAVAAESCPNLPDIKGSAKQVNWAISIRAKAILELAFEHLDRFTPDTEQFKMLSNTDNQWWISKNGNAAQIIMRILMEGAPKEVSMPDLEGTEAQNDWAHTIRSEAIDRIKESMVKGMKFDTEDGAIITISSFLYSEEIYCRSSWWIDNKGDVVAILLKEVKTYCKKWIIEYPLEKTEGNKLRYFSGDTEVFPGYDELAYFLISRNSRNEWEIWNKPLVL